MFAKVRSLLIEVSVVLLIVSFSLPLSVLANPSDSKAKPLTEDQKILHVLSRLGFGARPGDLERVRAMGLQKYIDQQLNPASIDDSLADSKVKNLEVFSMSTAEVFQKYPNPGALLRQLDGGKRAQAAKAAGQEMPKATEGMPTTDNAAADQAAAQSAQRERREKLQELYKEYNLRPAGQLVPQIVSNRVLRAVYSDRQLQEVMVDFWQNHFNVFSGKAAVRWYIPSYERDVLRKNALGNFKDLLIGTAEHPAMLFYLDNFESVAPNSQQNGNGSGRLAQAIRSGSLTPRMRERIMQKQGLTDEQLDQRIKRMQQAAKRPQRGINENYARELMELHTLGVDGGYTQKDIIEVAKAFTGWTIADPRGYRRAAAGMIKGTEDQRLTRLQKQPGVPDDLDSGEFYFNEKWHDKGPKMVLGHKIDAGGIKDGLEVLDLLVKNPATAKFIARKLCVRFVNDNPSEALVSRVSDAFHKSNGDIKTTLRAIFSDKEFFAPENYRSKIKTPFELAVSSIRALGGNTNAGPAMLAMLNKLGEVPYGYQAPTGYPDKAEDWVNTGALLERLNFAVAIASNRIPGTRVDLRGFANEDRKTLLDQAVAKILDGQISPATLSTLEKQVEKPLPEVKPGNELTDEPTDASNMPGAGSRRAGGRRAQLKPPTGDPEVFKVVSLVLGTPEFQSQ